MSGKNAPTAIIKKSPAAGELFDWLARPENYAENLLTAENAPLRLDPWQKEYLTDNSKFINILKSRRVGGSWAMTLKMFIRSQLSPNYSGTFISLNLEEATGKIEYANKMYESLPPRFRKKRVINARTELAFEDARGRRSTLKSIASRAPRGKGGDVGISELPHCTDQQKIYEGALHVTSRSASHQLTIESTPMGKTGIYFDVCRGAYPLFKRYEIPWWHCSALCADIARAREEAPNLSTRKRVESFGTPSLRAIYASMPEDVFRQESELAFIEAEESAFPAELVRKNCTESFGAHGEAELKFLSLCREPLADDWNWLATNRRGTLSAGFDVGRKKDESVLFILDNTGQKTETRMIVRLAQVDFATQEKTLSEAIRYGVKKLFIDSTGIGLPLAERMERAFGATIAPMHFTAPLKSRMVSALRVLLMDKKIVMPLDRDLLTQLASIRRMVSDSGDVLYRPTAAAGHHADMAWALMLACQTAQDAQPQPFHYEQVTTKKHSWRF